MVKFSREYEASIIPEWKTAFVDYKFLKKLIKRIKILVHPQPLIEGKDGTCCYGFYSIHPSVDGKVVDEESLESDSGAELMRSTDKHEREFLEKADEELEKVNSFYASQEAELLARGEALIEQLRILADVKNILHHQAPPVVASSSSVDGSSGRQLLPGLRSPLSMSGDGSVQLQVAIRIDIPATSPGRAALKALDELVNVRRRGGAAAFVHRKKIQHAEKSIRDGFVELYRGLDLLMKFSSLNAKAFTKILKKFVKVSGQELAADLFSEKVKRSLFSNSDKVLLLADEVECLFTKHFAGNDRKVAMKYLRPQQPKKTHVLTFLVGLFTGAFVSLFIVYAILAHVSGFFSSAGNNNTAYLEIVYHVFSMFALISLHVFLYGCNLLMWRSTRINHNFIFDFSSSSALTHQDAFLMSASIMCTVVAALVANLLLKNAGAFYDNALPAALLLLSTGVLIIAFNISYRSTLYCFMRVMRNIIFSPFYKVLMADFFMADQLTSQIPLLRHMEFASCYLTAGSFRTHPYETCSSSQQLKHLAYVLSFLPYYWRAMQCLRRYMEEGRDTNQLANAGKYVAAMVAAAVRFKHDATPTPFWMWMAVAASSGATAYQLYWDFVKDWGLLNPKSKNLWLRDELILKNGSIYYASMVLNVVLRLAWTQSVMKIHMEYRLLDFALACLEIMRRAHWNFYRLENEHLNNVGKFRAVKTVPLPFRELETDW